MTQLSKCSMSYVKMMPEYWNNSPFPPSKVIIVQRKPSIKRYLKLRETCSACSAWLHVLIMPPTRFRVKLHPIIAWFSRNPLFERGAISEAKWMQRDLTLKRVRDMIRTGSKIRTVKHSQYSSIIWPICLNSWVFVHELCGRRFESRPLKLQILRLFPARSSLTFRQL